MRRALIPLVLVLAGCSAGGVNPANLIQPGVRVHHLGLRNVGLSGGTLDVALAFHNPNGFSLQGTGLTARLDIEGDRFGDVDLADPFSLAGRDTTLITVPLTFRWSGVAAAARSIVNYGAVNYGIKGTFHVTAPAINLPIDVPFSGQGNVPLLRP
jgi:LEA14-like dessication related protein